MSEQHFLEDFPVGKTLQFCNFPLTRDLIESYAAEFDPLFGGPERDESRGRYASPFQLNGLLMRLCYDGWVVDTAARGAPGVDEARWFRPVAAGDTLTARYTVRAARVSRSKPQLGFVQFFYELFANGARAMSQLNWVMIERRNTDAITDAAESSARTSSDTPGQNAPASPIRLGEREFKADKIINFARIYDPQPFHVNVDAANKGPFGALAASGWHTTAFWASAYAEAYDAGRDKLPRPDGVLWMKPLMWQKPVYAGERIAFDFAPMRTETDASGRRVLVAQNRGIDSKGDIVIDFTIGMVIAE